MHIALSLGGEQGEVLPAAGRMFKKEPNAH